MVVSVLTEMGNSQSFSVSLSLFLSSLVVATFIFMKPELLCFCACDLASYAPSLTDCCLCQCERQRLNVRGEGC